MKSALAALALVLTTATAHAYKDGTYICKNVRHPELPANVYVFKTINFGEGVAQEHVTATLHYYDMDKVARESTLRGFTMRSDSVAFGETLIIGSLTFQFDGDALVNCKN